MFIVGTILKQKHVMEALYLHISDGYFQTGHEIAYVLLTVVTDFTSHNIE